MIVENALAPSSQCGRWSHLRMVILYRVNYQLSPHHPYTHEALPPHAAHPHPQTEVKVVIKPLGHDRPLALENEAPLGHHQEV